MAPTTLAVAMAYKHRGPFGSVPNVPTQAATFKDEIIAHDVLQVLIIQNHNNPVPRCQHALNQMTIDRVALRLQQSLASNPPLCSSYIRSRTVSDIPGLLGGLLLTLVRGS